MVKMLSAASKPPSDVWRFNEKRYWCGTCLTREYHRIVVATPTASVLMGPVPYRSPQKASHESPVHEPSNV
eukprot:CAMPEP_0202706364 /NCGR_PEP_ID=MMETSP1385-20130828/18793_1 /ASSEMBLY_ACC=CAM_ASM_000861 /TAXON_ID=933848 /ORGANISM="Elphidium margaritaceum" /LENGTH=70 /DNA_ID=CAMNT_0049364813 /DNA_START=333 /DNA_END=545 /DNA_ORIENTATION=+